MLKSGDRLEFVVNGATFKYDVRIGGHCWLYSIGYDNSVIFSVLGVDGVKACTDAGIKITLDEGPRYWPVVGSAKDLQLQVDLVNKLIGTTRHPLSSCFTASSGKFGCQHSNVLQLCAAVRAKILTQE